MNITRLYNTVRHLKSRQILGQVKNRMRTVLEVPLPYQTMRVPGFSACSWIRTIAFPTPGIQDNGAAEIINGRMKFINRIETVGWPPDWKKSYRSKLWRYNLHYFEWLWALDYKDAKFVVLDWIRNNPPAEKQVAWEAYPVSLRLMNWCGVLWGRHRMEIEGDPDFLAKLWHSFYLQCQWLSGHLEIRLLGNHYFENGAALAFAGSCFEGESAKRWFDKGLAVLREQIPEQIPSDGMHFELSPMYHSRILYLLTLLHATGNTSLQALTAEPMGRMLGALKSVCHPDGRIALLNDSAFGIYNEPSHLLDYCGRLLGRDYSRQDCGCFALPDAGFYGWRDMSGNYLICDVGKIGPDYIPGHAHADMLSFELSLAGRRVVVDSGVHDYEDSQTRRYCRSTAGHNTVEIESHDQCETWSVFRVGRRGYPINVKWKPSADRFKLEAAHNGYRRLPGAPIHRRLFQWNPKIGLKVFDRVEGSRVFRAKSRIHFHPDCKIEKRKDGVYESKGANAFKINVFYDCKSYLEKSTYHPEFGLNRTRQTLVIESQRSESGFCIGIGR